MLERLLRWKIVIAIVVVVVLVGTIHYTSLTRPKISLLESAWRDFLAPLQTGISRTQRFFQGQIEGVRELSQLRTDNEELRTQVLALQQEVLALRNYQRENQWLREALDFKSELEHQLLVAEVIARSPSKWENTIILNKGLHHGVTPGMAVITNWGIVGTVINSSQFTSTVLLAIDPQSATGGLVQDSGDLVLVQGMEGRSGDLLATPLSRDTTVKVDDVIITSGLSRIYPKNLPIGKVIAVESRQYDLSFAAVVRPFVDFTRLEYVLIVQPSE